MKKILFYKNLLKYYLFETNKFSIFFSNKIIYYLTNILRHISLSGNLFSNSRTSYFDFIWQILDITWHLTHAQNKYRLNEIFEYDSSVETFNQANLFLHKRFNIIPASNFSQ